MIREAGITCRSNGFELLRSLNTARIFRALILVSSIVISLSCLALLFFQNQIIMLISNRVMAPVTLKLMRKSLPLLSLFSYNHLFQQNEVISTAQIKENIQSCSTHSRAKLFKLIFRGTGCGHWISQAPINVPH